MQLSSGVMSNGYLDSELQSLHKMSIDCSTTLEIISILWATGRRPSRNNRLHESCTMTEDMFTKTRYGPAFTE